MPGWVFSLLQFFPLSLFAGYACWNGPPDEQRWRVAFGISAVAAIIQLAILLPQRRPVNRLVLAGNVYLLLGGLAFFTSQWWFLRYYDSLRETAIFLLMMAVGILSMITTRAGYAGLSEAPRGEVLRASVILLGATVLALAVSIAFRGNRYLAAVLPIIALAVLQRTLTSRYAIKPTPQPPS
jgi:hypothetical protein